MNLKNNIKDKTYRALVISGSIFEGFVGLTAYLAYINGNQFLFAVLGGLFLLEVLSVGYKLAQYEKKVLKIM
ncbi:MAG TPA: hypothetical protein VJ912_00610 [Candidatus Nanoarchaeia archaeon]|nr:hypothetical protein [Candidatus Nanoarchaeia archaeon]